MTLRNPEARGISTDRLLNYIDCYSERAMTVYCDFQGIDIYIADELFAMTGFDKDGVPYFTFHSHDEDPEEAEFFQESQEKSRNEVLLRERLWIRKNMTQESFDQIMEALMVEKDTKSNIITHLSEYPRSAIDQGFLMNLGAVLECQTGTNLVNLVQRFCLTQEIKSYMMWYEKMNHAL